MITQPGQPAPKLDVDAYVRGEADPRAFTVGGPAETRTVLFFHPRGFTFVCPTELRGTFLIDPHGIA